MTAIGLFMFMLGTLIVNLFGADAFEKTKLADYVGTATAFSGLALAVFGLLLWIWDVMP